MYHQPVLLLEAIKGLAIRPGGVYVDVTYGGGGHSKEILPVLGNGNLIAFDTDEDAIQNKIDDERLIFINSNFKYLKNFLQLYNFPVVDGILADLGISSHQLDSFERGFAARMNSKIDLRMDKRQKLTAIHILNKYDEESLKDILHRFAELPNSGKLAYLICKSRKERKIETVNDLISALKPTIPFGAENRFLARIFQALRIEINDELGALEELLLQSLDVLKPGGRLVVISYHSLEDRLVKNFMKSGNFKGTVEEDFFGNRTSLFNVITKKPITPGSEELARNSRSRSAKLRVAEKL